MQNRSMKQGLGKSVWWVRTILIEFLPDILPLSPPPSVSARVERLFRPGKEREWRSEKDLFISSLCFYLHFLPPRPCTISVLSCLSPLPSLLSLNLLLPPPPHYLPPLSSLLSSPVPVLLRPSSSWVDSGRWLISWRHSGCPLGTVVSWNWLLGASRQEKALESSADAQQGIRKSLWYRDAQQGIRMPLWYRHQVLVYVQDLRRSCGQHGGVCIGKTGHGYSLPMVYQHLSGSWAPESYSRNYRHSLPVLRTGWDELYPEKEGLCPISAPQCKAGPVWI